MSSTVVWGPSAGWPSLDTLLRNLHALSLQPDRPDIDVADMIDAWHNVLPCGACRESSGQFLQENDTRPPDDAYDTEAMVRWAYALHNRVNRKKADNNMDVTPAPPFDEYYESIVNVDVNDPRVQREAVDAFWNLVLPYAMCYEPKETEKKTHLRKFARYAKYFLPMTDEYDNVLEVPCREENLSQRWKLFYCVLDQSPLRQSTANLAKYLAAKSTSCTKTGCK